MIFSNLRENLGPENTASEQYLPLGDYSSVGKNYVMAFLMLGNIYNSSMSIII